MSDQTAVYHIFGDANLLLYIGISDNFGRRWKEHAKRQPWWGEHRWMTVRWYDSRKEAEDAEEVAIKAERPIYNKTHAVKTPVMPSDPEEMAVHETAELVRAATAERDEARAEHITAVLAALRAGRPPMGVAELSPFTDTRLRQIAREAGIPPAVKGKRAPTG